MYKNGLAYRKKAPVNWCPSCQTVLANEQVVEGQCERCDSDVLQKDLKQWFFKIIDYAEKLLQGHDTIDWPEKTILMQKNWIGKSIGASIKFLIFGSKNTIDVFTTRPDTIFGVTYMVLAPEHPLAQALTTDEYRKDVDNYIKQAQKSKEIERLSTDREKTGVFTGSFCINPANNEKVQIWIADYVLVTYGTGAVMAVPAHDERDFAFAKKFNLPIKKVIIPNLQSSELPFESAFTSHGFMVNSGPFDGMESINAKDAIVEWLSSNNFGEKKTNYKLRDWLISRQRYWGAPIPIVYCEKCGEVAVPETELPVVLPENVDFSGQGVSPIATAEEFVNTSCPNCGGQANREVDTMDTFVCSSWYYLRYPNPQLDDAAFDSNLINSWMPVDQYVGGAEHSVMHLLYARFFTKVLHDLGLVDFDEPFQRLIHQGTITSSGAKMSKSKGNVVNPDNFIKKFGSDTFRMYMMFMGSYEEGGDWNDDGISGINRFIKRVWRLVQQVYLEQPQGSESESFSKVLRQTHHAIKHATQSLERFHFNTAISRVMELVNESYLYLQEFGHRDQNTQFLSFVMPNIVQLMAPFAPHMAEELWDMLGKDYSIFNSNWPQFDETMLIENTVNFGIQVNGKIRGQIVASVEASNEEIIRMALENERISKYTSGKKIIKAIVVPNKLVVFAVK